MSDNLKERLRKHVSQRGGSQINGAWRMMEEAADRIEELERKYVGALARVERLREALFDTTTHLVAARSLASKGGRKGVASDKMFWQMLNDYQAAIDRARAALNATAPSEQPWDDTAPTLEFGYTNWRGEHSTRVVWPIRLWYGSTEYHPEQQWFLKAFDVDKQAERDFALRDMLAACALLSRAAGNGGDHER